MKKILFGIVLSAALLSCSEDNLPHADFARFQVESVTAVGGDETVTLSWTLQEGKPAPQAYYVSWTTSSVDAENGERTIPAPASELTIDRLTNDCAYTFSVQPRYPEGLAMKVSTTCTPKSTRIAATDFKAMAGDGRVYLTWKAPETQLDYTYRLETTTEETEAESIELTAGETSYLAEGLTNGRAYGFALTCVYTHGDSPTVNADATPGEIDPITVTSNVLRQFERCTFEYNPAYFVSGEIVSVKWEFGDGQSSTEKQAAYCYPKVGTYTVTLTVAYDDGKTETAVIELTVEAFAWTTIGGVGYQKASHIVFSHDGQTFYTVSQTTKTLFAVNAITGAVVWEYATSAATYGAGPVVGADGTIYFGTEDTAGSFFAISSSGAKRWDKSLGAAVKAAPAVTSDGTLYVLTDGGVLHALDAATGSEKWVQTQSGNAGGVAVDKDGTVYMGTATGIWAYTENGTLKWASEEAHTVTERGGSLAIGDGILYATLKGKAGCAAVDAATGRTLWKYTTGYGDCYHPVVDAAGTVYFCEKAGGLYAVGSDGTAKWTDETEKNYTYSGFALDIEGNAYISQYASPFDLLSFDAAGGRHVATSIGAQTMSPVTIGADGRIYYGLNGSVATHDAATAAAVSGWPMRGCNLQGTNSLK